MKSLNKFVVILSVLVLVLSAPMVSAQDEIESVCLVTDVGRVNDGTFNQFAHEGALAAAEDFELEYDFIETTSEADYQVNIQTCVDEGFDIVLTIGFLIQDATFDAAVANPDVFFAGVDQFVSDRVDEDGNVTEEAPSNFIGLQFREEQAGFLVGALAALVANEFEEDTIAGVYGLSIPPVVRFRNGYEQGALLINPDWELGTNILGVYASSFIDEPQGVSLAQQFMGEDAFVIFGAGGPTGSAAIKEAASQGVYVVGVDKDEYFSTFGNGEREGSEFLISSALKGVDQGVYDAIAFLAEGDMDAWNEYGGGVYVLDAALGGVGFAPRHDADSVPEELYEQVDEILEGLISGDIVLDIDPGSGLAYCDAAQYREEEGCVEPMDG
jgi:basic membrane protein A and related proteins